MPATYLAVVNYEMDGVGGCRWIVYGTDPQEYVREVARSMVSSAKELVEHYSEAINCSELQHLHENYGEGEYPEEGWNWRDVMKLLDRLPEIAVSLLDPNDPRVETTHWYSSLIGFLNDVFPDGSGVWFNMEGAFKETLQNLFLDEVRNAKFYKMSDQYARWLGRLAVVAQWEWESEITESEIQAVHSLARDFDKLNEFR